VPHYSVHQIAEALKLTAKGVEQWVQRGYVRPVGDAGRGRRARRWTEEDGCRVELCRQLVASPLSPISYGDAIEAGIAAPDCFLLITTGLGKGPIDIVETGGRDWQIHRAPSWRTATRDEVAALFSDEKSSFRQVTVIHVPAILAETRAALADLTERGEE
jgi:hypothetical protein